MYVQCIYIIFGCIYLYSIITHADHLSPRPILFFLYIFFFAGSVAAFFQSLSVVNVGIAQGTGDSVDGGSTRFASNLFMLCVRYVSLIFKNAQGGVCSILSCGIILYSLLMATKLIKDGMDKESASKRD